jgi:hypothetical protein
MLFLRLLGGLSLCGGPAGGRSASPCAWALGNGKVSFEMVVERAVDMGNHLHAVGAVGGVRMDFGSARATRCLRRGDRVRIAARAHVPLG